MDIIADILDSVWLSGSLFFRANLNGDWGVLYEPTPSPVFHYIVAGEAWHVELIGDPQGSGR